MGIARHMSHDTVRTFLPPGVDESLTMSTASTESL